MTMDVMFDASFVVPAVLFTILAVILASSLLRKNRAPVPQCDPQHVHDAPAERSATEDECVPAEDEIGEVRQAAAREVEEVQAEAETGVTGGEEEEPEPEPEATAGPLVVEDVGAVKEEPLGEAGMKDDEQETILKPVSAPTLKEQPNAEPMLAPVLEGLPPPETKKVNAEAIPTATSATVPPSQPEPDPLSEPTASASSGSQTLTELTPQSTFEPCPEQIPKSSQLSLQETAAESSPVKEPIVKNEDAAPPSSQEEEEALKYVPGKLRTSQFEKLMTKEELEEEQRVQKEQLAAIFQLLRDNKETFGEVTEADVEEQLKLYSI